jgi:hypothetical protein
MKNKRIFLRIFFLLRAPPKHFTFLVSSLLTFKEEALLVSKKSSKATPSYPSVLSSSTILDRANAQKADGLHRKTTFSLDAR